MKKNLRRKSNKGFTLTEVIIAVSILAIAATPLISNFVKSGSMNKRAREHLNAMNIAQDIMEGFSAYKGEDLMNKFESGKSLYGTVLPAGMEYASHGDYAHDGSTISYVVINQDDGTVTTTGSQTYSKVVDGDISKKIKISKTDPKYYFYIKGLKQQKTTYNVDVEISYNDYQATTGVDLNRMYDVKPKVDCVYSNVENYAAGVPDSDAPAQLALSQFVSRISYLSLIFTE